MNPDSLREESGPTPPGHRHQLRRGPPNAPPKLDGIDESGNAKVQVPGRDLPATEERDRSVELDSSYWIG